MSMPPGPEPRTVASARSGGPGVAGPFVAYGLARLALFALIAGLLAAAGAPLVISALVALIVALPLSMLVFRGLRGRLDEALAVAQVRRQEQRAALRAGLRGESGTEALDRPGPVDGPLSPETGSGDRPQREADGGGG